MQLRKKKDEKEKKIEVLQGQIADLTSKWKRALADYQNLEKNSQQEKKNWIEFTSSDLILKLLPVIESLEKAEEHLKNKGLELTIDQLKNILEKEGLQSIPIKAGESTFNADVMECIGVEKGEEGKVLKVAEKGYTLKGRLLKPARVVVGKKIKN